MKPGYTNNLFLGIFSISPEEAKFARRGFRVTESRTVTHLETIGEKFLHGYHTALSAPNISELQANLNLVEPLYRGFAFEGAAMGLTLLDYLLPFRRKRFPEFIRAGGDAHVYMSYVGAGWAFARIPWLRRNVLKRISDRYDSLLKWLILDGYGFHEGYFSPHKYFRSGADALKNFPDYARHAFAQGLGRSLWFVEGAAGEKIAATLERFPIELRGDLWSGVGLACAYAGGAERAEIETLKDLAVGYLPHLAQGAAFAAKTRERAGNPAEHTENACRVLCGCTAEDAALITDLKLKNLPADAGAEVPAYDVWRKRIQKEFLFEEATV